MAKQKLEVEESKVNYTSDIMLDDSELANESFSEMEIEKSVFKEIKNKKEINQTTDKEMINCLRQERVLVRHIPKEGGMISNPKHILYGGMAENAIRYFTVPKLSSGMYVNVLTDKEKEFLEEVMGLEYNTLSIYKKVDNYWENNMVRLTKQDNVFDLSDPE